MAPHGGDTGGSDPSVILAIFTHALHKTMFFCEKSTLGRPGPPMGHTGRPSYATNRHTNGVTRGFAVSELSSDVPKLTLATCPTPWVDFACLTSSMLPYET